MQPRLAAFAVSMAVTMLVRTADSRAEPVDLVHNTRCEVGGLGPGETGARAQLQWRVQLGVFADGAAAYAREDELRARGVAVEVFAVEHDGAVRHVVVSAPARDRRAAAAAAKRLRRWVADAFARQYRVWR